MATAIVNRVENFRNRLQASQLAAFLRWWMSELRGMLPAGLQTRLQHARRRLLLQLREGELEINVSEPGVLHQLDVVSLERDSRLQRQQLQELLHDRELFEVARDFLVPEPRVLRKEVFLPAAAESSLRQALSFEMDRQTPFPADEVFFDYRVLQRDREAGQLKIDLVVTQREPLLQDIRLLSTLGLAPSGADIMIDGKPAGLNLLPPAMRKRIVNSKSRANLMLAGVFLLLLVFVMAQSLLLKQHQLSEVQDAVAQVREEAMRVQDIRTRIKDASEAAGFLLEQRAAAIPSVEVLAEVTRVLPDNTYLDRLLIDAESVQMQGKSENAQQLIELVNQSPLFEDAAFRGPTRLDSRTQKEIFDIAASLVPGGKG